MTARCLGAVCAIVALLAPATAAAKPTFKVKPEGFAMRLFLEGRDGDLIVVSSRGHKQVELTALGDEGIATYRAPGRASREGIEADFGAFGQVALRFHGKPGPLSRKKQANCRGKRAIGAAGAFRGSVEFEGAGGFAEVRARKARGYFIRSFRRVCKVPAARRKRAAPGKSGGPRLAIRANTLIAESREHGARTRFVTIELELDSGRQTALLTFVVATSTERVGAVRVSREAFTAGGEGVLLVGARDREPALAKVVPPGPFRGTGTYRKEAGSPADWNGSLAVPLPEVGVVPLAGDGFRATLCRNVGGFDRCQARLGELAFAPAEIKRWLAQGSGSQSQVLWDDRLSWSR